MGLTNRLVAPTIRIAGLCMILALVAISLFAEKKNQFIYRGFWDQGSLVRDPDVFQGHIKRAASLGYNFLFSADHKLQEIEDQPQSHRDKYQRALTSCKAHNIKLIPVGFHQSYPARENMDLSEGFPVKGTQFVVNNGEARAQGDHDIALKNGGFESGSSGWGRAYLPATHGFVDKSIYKSGTASFRVKNAPEYSRLTQTIKLKPFRAYQISGWFRTSKLKNQYLVQFGMEPHMLHRRERPFGTPLVWSTLSHTNLNWSKCVIDFNSLHHTEGKLSIWFCYRMKGGQGGDLWVDDVEVREVGLYETMRVGKPLAVKSFDGSKVYKEGTDYVVDPKCNSFTNESFNYEGHLKIPAGSAIKDGDKLRVDWCQHANVETMVAESDFCPDKTWATLQDNLNRIDSLFGNSDAMFCGIDEWRVGGWNPQCEAFQFANSGDYVAKVWRKINCMLRKTNGCRTVFLVGDMYDPYFNAWNGPYGMWESGNVHGAHKGLTGDELIIQWNVNAKAQSLRMFAGLDPKYPDVKNPQIVHVIDHGAMSVWLTLMDKLEKEEKDAEGFVGCTYTNWYRMDYPFMEEVAAVCKAHGRWASNSFPAKTCAPIKDCDVPGPNLREPQTRINGEIRLHAVSGSSRNVALEFSMPEYGQATLLVFDSQGRHAQTLVNNKRTIGAHRVNWNTSALATGIYFLRLSIEGVASRTLKQIVL